MSKQYATALRKPGRKKIYDLELEDSLEDAAGLAKRYNSTYHYSPFEMVVVELKVVVR